MISLLRKWPQGWGRFCYANLKLSIDSKNRSAYVTLSNQRRRNPLSLETIRQLHSCLLEVQYHIDAQKLKILILRGEGPVFSAGHDLKELKDTPHPEEIFNECNKTMVLLKYFPLITLCAVNNMATAAGLQLALTCDIIIATKGASFGIPGMKRGLFPSTPLVQLERSLKSRCLTKEIVIFGEMLTAQEAFSCGLINKVVAEDQLEEEVNAYIVKANKLSGQVVALGKRVLNSQLGLDLEKAYAVAEEGMRKNVVQTDDCREGLQAFSEKRQPHFKN